MRLILRPAATLVVVALAINFVPVALGADNSQKADDALKADNTKKTDVYLGMTPDAAKGFELLMSAPMATAVMKVADIDRLWTAWEPDEKAKAEAADPITRKKMTFERYGWAMRPGDTEPNLPLDYTVDNKGNLVTNCFSCHGGKVAGKTIPGAGNTHVDLTTLATDLMRLRAVEAGADPEKVKDAIAPFKTPLNYHKGVTNAVIFAPLFYALRDPTLAQQFSKNPELLLHHDMNPPPWWNFKKKTRIYADAFAPKTPRQLMPFAMSPLFSEEKFRSFEPNFVHIYQYVEELEAPKYPFAIDADLAARGKGLFEKTCSECHGTYGPGGEFPNRVDSDRRNRHRWTPAAGDLQGASRAIQPRLAAVLWRAPDRLGIDRLPGPTARRRLGLRPVLPQRRRSHAVGRDESLEAAQGLEADRRRLRPEEGRTRSRRTRCRA